MKKAVLVLVVCIGLAVAVILGLAATKSDDFAVERSITIERDPDRVFPLISDLRSWRKWSPWEEKDPQMQRTFKGPESGKGAIYEWSGNDDVGEGSMQITDLEEPTKVALALHFVKPFEDNSDVLFSLTPVDKSTRVTWSMKGKNNFVSKIMQVFMNIEEMCGNDFETGLAKLKSTAEALPEQQTEKEEPETDPENAPAAQQAE